MENKITSITATHPSIGVIEFNTVNSVEVEEIKREVKFIGTDFNGKKHSFTELMTDKQFLFLIKK